MAPHRSALSRRNLSAGRFQKSLRHFTVYCLLLSLILPCSAVFAEDSSHSVRVGMFPSKGYYEVDQDGRRSGFGYDFLQMMAQHANFSYTYIDDVPVWSQMEDMLENGDLDMLTGVQKTPETEARFSFSASPVGSSYTMITVKSGNDSVSPGDYATYSGLKVGVIRGNAHARKFEAFAREKQISYQLLEYENWGALQTALQSGGVDMAVTSSLRPLENEWIIEQFNPSPYYLMMRKNDTQLISEVNQAMKQLDVSSPNWRTELYNRYYTSDSGDKIQFSAEERAFLRANKQTVFQVAVCPDNAPYSSVKNGTAQGIIPDIFKEIARRAGIQYQIVAADTHQQYRDQINSGKIDLIMDSGWDYSAAEKKGYKLTNSYISLPIAQISKITGSEKPGVVAVPEGSLLEELSKSSLAAKYSFKQYPSVSSTIKAVSDGSCDMAFVYYADAQQYLASDARSQMKISLLPNQSVSLSIASAARNDYLLLSILSKSADSVKGSFARDVVLNYTVSASEHINLLDYLYLNPVWSFVSTIFVGLLFLAVLFNIYQRVWYKRQKRLSANLAAAKLDAESANAAKSLFLSSMSHDLRTPLNGILGFAKLAAEESDPLLKQDYLTKIRSSGDLLLSLVNDTLELSRIESGKMTLDAKAIDSHELIETVIAAVKPSADQKNIRLLTDFSAFPFGWVCVDRSKVQKILLNLLSNAVKYTPAGGTVSFSVSLSEPSQGPCNGHIVIEDTGIGMSEEFLSRLYEPFTQEHRMGPDAADGTGLGLSIVKKTVDFLGGSICVDSKINLGTRFTVDLPMPPADGIDPTSAQSEQDAVVLQGKRVLLCEDNQINTEIAVLLLKKHGILTDCAPNGKAGFELYASAPAGTYDAVLLDIRMPVMDGYDTARAIRSFPREDAASIPIIAMTADAFENDVKKCSEAGMNDHIPKPIDPALLEQALKKAFAKPPQA